MRYRLNFSSPAVDKRKRTLIRRITGGFYLLLWIFSAYVLFQVYSTGRFMANTFQAKISKIEKKISNIEPRALFLEREISERNRLGKQASLYIQEEKRPSVWYARLFELAGLLPPDLVLTKIAYLPPEKQDDKKPEITLDGFTVLRGNEQDVFAVDDFRSALSESLPTTFTYSKLLVDRNRIYKEKDNLKLVFSLGYYR